MDNFFENNKSRNYEQLIEKLINTLKEGNILFKEDRQFFV